MTDKEASREATQEASQRLIEDYLQAVRETPATALVLAAQVQQLRAAGDALAAAAGLLAREIRRHGVYYHYGDADRADSPHAVTVAALAAWSAARDGGGGNGGAEAAPESEARDGPR